MTSWHLLQVQLLSPVCSEKGDVSLLDSSLPDISFPPGIAGGPVVGLRDPVDNRITLVGCLTVFDKIISSPQSVLNDGSEC